MNYLTKLLHLLSNKNKKRLSALVFFSIFISLVETLGISAIMPFINIAINFDNIHSNQYFQNFYDFFSFESEVDFTIAFGFLLLGFYFFRGAVTILHSYLIAQFTEHLYAETTKNLFKTYLNMPYYIFASKNSSYLTKTIMTEATLLSKVIFSALLLMSEVFLVLFLYTVMLFVNWKITVSFTVVLSLMLLFLLKTVSKKVKLVGQTREEFQSQYYEIINKLFGNFKQIKLQDKNRLILTKEEFSNAVTQYAKSAASGSFFSAFPRLFIETVGFSLIVLLLVSMLYLSQSNIAHILPTLSLFGIALYRLLPSVNRIVTGFNAILFHHKCIEIIHEEMLTKQELSGNDRIAFKEKIELENANFFYKEKKVLNSIDLSIIKGEKIAFVGESGSGKSTLVDIIIGLHVLTDGDIKVDGVLVDEANLQNWRSQIGYIPQQVYLFDGTIAENVCFGRELDKDLLEKVLSQANILDFLQKKQGIETMVGEDGIQLSGGQKQRIAIARALYGQPEVLVLDEATSALDDETEKKIMNEIYKISEDKTLIIIAHRLTTIHGCDKIFTLKNGKIENIE